MKKIGSKQKHELFQKIKKKRSIYSKSRRGKVFVDIVTTYADYVESRNNKKIGRKNIPAPRNFSFIDNCDESLEFFDKFFLAVDEGYTDFHFDMTNVDDLGIETLLYIISLDKIYKEKISMALKISIPKNQNLRYKMIVSGFIKYFKSNILIDDIDEETVFPICDGASNKQKDKDDGETCAEAVEFAKKFIDSSQHRNELYRLLYVSLAELMLNTENHAYDENDGDIVNNWYLFAVQLEKGIAFYFFDNGLGINKTARKKIVDMAYGLIGLEQTTILKSVLDGEFRSKTGLQNRGKGLPQINSFLKHSSVLYSFILTNKVLSVYNINDDNNTTFQKIKHNFRGSLFVWVLPDNNL